MSNRFSNLVFKSRKELENWGKGFGMYIMLNDWDLEDINFAFSEIERYIKSFPNIVNKVGMVCSSDEFKDIMEALIGDIYTEKDVGPFQWSLNLATNGVLFDISKFKQLLKKPPNWEGLPSYSNDLKEYEENKKGYEFMLQLGETLHTDFIIVLATRFIVDNKSKEKKRHVLLHEFGHVPFDVDFINNLIKINNIDYESLSEERMREFLLTGKELYNEILNIESGEINELLTQLGTSFHENKPGYDPLKVQERMAEILAAGSMLENKPEWLESIYTKLVNFHNLAQNLETQERSEPEMSFRESKNIDDLLKNAALIYRVLSQ